MKNLALKKVAKELAGNPTNTTEIKKGTIGGISIEVETKEPLSFDSFLYKTEEARDHDLEKLNELLK